MAPPEEQLGVLEASAALHARHISAAELLTVALCTIDRTNGGQPSFDGSPHAINAWARLYPERAAAMARSADERLAREGAEAPLLCGVPIGVKDLFAVGGLPLTASSRVLRDAVGSADCELWSRLARAGMVLVGHTHTHEFGLGSTTDQVGNPWDRSCSAGGSSGGSAAAVAAGMVPVAIGTDTAGSLRIPAAMCGISSIKPTLGRLPMEGVIPLAPSLDHAGPMARTVADCAAVLAAMAEGGSAPSTVVPSSLLGGLSLTARGGVKPLAGCRIALLPVPAELTLDDDVAIGIEFARMALERLGASVFTVVSPTFGGFDEFQAIFDGEATSYHHQFADDAELYRPFLREYFARARETISLADYLAAQKHRVNLVMAWERWMDEQRADLLLQPTVVAPAPRRKLGYSSPPGTEPWIHLTFTWNMTGFPVVSLPAGLGRESSLPIGVSLISRRGLEASLIQVAIDLQEREMPPPRMRLSRRPAQSGALEGADQPRAEGPSGRQCG